MEPAAGHSVKLDPVTLESTGDEEVKGHDFTAHDKQMLEISPLKSIDEKKGDLERTKTQVVLPCSPMIFIALIFFICLCFKLVKFRGNTAFLSLTI